MADIPGRTVDDRAKDLELLESGNFADVEVVCGDRTWKCHRAILVPRSVWFEKALAGPFEEASTRRVNLDEENPACVDLALKYIYGRGLDVEASISPDHFIEHCVSLWHLADFLLLGPLKSPVEKAVRHYCDKWTKQFFTYDLVSGVRQAYKWKVVPLKAVLTEFIWVGRSQTLGNGAGSVMFHHLADTPNFIDDFLGHYASRAWINDAVWALRNREEAGWRRGESRCQGCPKVISWSNPEGRVGQLVNPFELNVYNGVTAGWCRDCAKLDTIPWRK